MPCEAREHAVASTVGVTRRIANVAGAHVGNVGGHRRGPRASTWRSRRRAPRPRRGPSQRSIHHSRDAYIAAALVVGDDLLASRRCRGGRTARRAASGVGSGWRPFVPGLRRRTGRDRGATKRAPGMWPARYCASPQVSGCARSWRTSTITNAGSSRCAASSAVEISVVYMCASGSAASSAQRSYRCAMCASISRRRNSWKCCMPSSIGDW